MNLLWVASVISSHDADQTLPFITQPTPLFNPKSNLTLKPTCSDQVDAWPFTVSPSYFEP